MAKKQELKTSVWVFVFWLLVAIIGSGLLFSGLQSGLWTNNSMVKTIMLIVVGIILIFIGLVMVLGKANLEVEKTTTKKVEKK